MTSRLQTYLNGEIRKLINLRTLRHSGCIQIGVHLGMINHIHKLWSKYRIVLFFLALFSLLVYGKSIFTPSLLGDEWGNLNAYVNEGGPLCPDWNTSRPFGNCWLWAVHHIIGVNIYAYHGAAVLVTLLSSLLLLVFLEQVLPGRLAFNTAAAALFLVYPADMTRTWLAGHIVFANAIFVGAVCFLAAFWRSGYWRTWVLGMLVLLFALGTYEVSVGVTIVLSVIAAMWGRKRTWCQRSALLAPAVLAIVFSIWRWQWQMAVKTAFGHNVETMTFSIMELFSRLIFGYRVNLQWVWTDAILDWLSFLGQNTRTGRVLAVVVLGALVLGLMAIINVILKRRMASNQVAEIGVDLYGIKHLMGIAGLALIGLGAGYFPIFLAAFPGMDYVASRTHHLPSIGAAIFICAVLFAVARLFTRDLRRRSVLAVVGLVPLLLLGIGAHISVQQHVNRAWEDQKRVWQSLFEIAPGIVDGTQIFMIMDGYQNGGLDPRPSGGPWSTSAALNILYGSKDLSGDFFYGSPDEVLQIDDGELYFASGNGTRPATTETLVFVFDRASRHLAQLTAIDIDGEMMSLGAGRILDGQTKADAYRWLVQD